LPPSKPRSRPSASHLPSGLSVSITSDSVQQAAGGFDSQDRPENRHPPRLAVVVPRYGPDVIGGAESQARGFAEEAAGRGWPVEVWTTCARDHFSWANSYPAGVSKLNGVTVRRYPITSRAPEQQANLETKVITQGVLTAAEQYDWLVAAAHSAPLYGHIARHAADFDALIALPYANPIIHYAAWSATGRVIVWPCLHDEPYTYMEPTRLLLETVWGAMFNSPEEAALATGKLGMNLRRAAVLGEGVELAAVALDRAEAGSPYLIYVGRLEEGKNLRLLYDYVRRNAEDGRAIPLVVIGKGPLEPPDHPAFDFRGFVSEAEKARLCAGALALCQPSLNESFSLTIMESWLAGRPVLVSEACAVTREHVRRSKGGLWFDGYEEFARVVSWLLANPALAGRMGRNGQQYVRQNYSWRAVVDRFARILKGWREDERAAAAPGTESPV
jgi:glycosyltransferase involved in cell wall biosynthesis